MDSKQIEEMAKLLENNHLSMVTWDSYNDDFNDNYPNECRKVATVLFNAGYRKISENNTIKIENNSFEEELRKLLTEHDREVAETMLETFICKLIDLRLLNVNDDMYYEMLEAKDCLIEEEYGAKVE